MAAEEPQRGAALLSSIRRRVRGGVAAAGLFSVFLALLQLAMPLYTMQVYDRVLGSRSEETLVALTVLAVGCFAVFALLEAVRARLCLALGHMAAKTLTPDALGAALRALPRGGEARPSQVLRDVAELRQFLASPAVAAPFDAALSLVFLGFLTLVHPAYGAVSALAILLLVGLSLLGRAVTGPAVAAAGEASMAHVAEVEAATHSVEAVEAMGMEPALRRRWRIRTERTLALVNAANRHAQSFSAIAKGCRMAAQVAIVATGTVLVIDRAVSPGSMLAASILMGRALTPFEQLIDGWRSWITAREGWRRLEALLAAEAAAPAGVVPDAQGRLVVDRVTYLPPGAERPTLRGVSFTVEPGETVGIVGASAAGKSTLARLLVGVLEPAAGGVYLDGQKVAHWERAAFGRHVGYVPQTVGLLGATVEEAIARLGGADGRIDRARVVAAARRADVHEMIGRLPQGYQSPIGEGGARLSGGQRQRLALARALYGEPRLLVLDEPNANLDQAGEAALARAIAEARQGGSAVVVVTHRPSILGMLDRIIVLRDGAIDRMGPRTEMLRLFTPGGPAVPAAATA